MEQATTSPAVSHTSSAVEPSNSPPSVPVLAALTDEPPTPPPGDWAGGVLRLSRGGTLHVAEQQQQQQQRSLSLSPRVDGPSAGWGIENQTRPGQLPTIGIFVQGRRFNKAELRILCIGILSSLLLLVTVVAIFALAGTTDPVTGDDGANMLLGPATTSAPAGQQPLQPPPPPPSPLPSPAPPPLQYGFVVRGSMRITPHNGGRFDDRRFRQDLAHVTGTPESEVLITGVDASTTLVSFEIFVPTLVRAGQLEDLLRAQASSRSSALLLAPSIRGSPTQILALSVSAVVTSPLNGQVGDGTGRQAGTVLRGTVLNPVARGSATVPRAGTAGHSGAMTIVGDASFTAYVNGHLVGTGQNSDHGVLIRFEAPCDERQVFAIAAESSSSTASIIAQIDHCGFTILTNPAWKCHGAEGGGASSLDAAWYRRDFDDTSWQWAVDGGINGVEPWGTQHGISAHSRWIWPRVGDQLQPRRSHSFCRYYWGRQSPTDVPVGGDVGQTHITADDHFRLFVNGLVIGTGSAWTHTSAYTFVAPCSANTVFAIEAENAGGQPALLMESSHCGTTFQTGRRWRCSPLRYDGWHLPGFDDSEWPSATDGGTNGGAPWAKRPQISGAAHWIWTTDPMQEFGPRTASQVQFDLPAHHTKVFCRFISVNQPLNCPAARAKYYDDYRDVAASHECTCCASCSCCPAGCESGSDNACGYGSHSRHGAWHHFMDYGRRQGRVWHSELCRSDGADRILDRLGGSTGHINVAGDLFRVHVNGVLLGSGQDWTRRHSFGFRANCSIPIVYAISAHSASSFPTIAAEIDHCGTNLQSSPAWKCGRCEAAGWELPSFDDRSWQSARDGGANGVPPFGARPELSGRTHWIWLTNQSDLWCVIARVCLCAALAVQL
jgi:hypothetical protein